MTGIPIPKKVFLVSGKGEGPTELNAFDSALLAAGIGNTNLVKISSVLPPNVELVDPFRVPEGSLVPIAYASHASSTRGVRISAAVAIGIPKDPSLPGLIMETGGEVSKEKAEEMAIKMVEDGFRARGYELGQVKVISTEGVCRGIWLCVFAGAVLFW